MRVACLVLPLSLAGMIGMGAAPPPQAQTPAPTPQATIRTNVQEVVLDLTVHDAKGRDVKNLKPGDIEVYEDGVKQQIRSFRLVSGKEALAEQQVAQAGAGGVYRNPLPTTNLVCLVFHNLDPSMIAEKQAVQAAEEFLKYHLQPGTWVGIFGLDATLTVLEPFTTDQTALLRAAANGFSGHSTDFNDVAAAILNASPNVATTRVSFNGNPAAGGTVSASSHISGGNLNSRAIVGADVANGPGARSVRGDQADARRQLGGIEARQQFDQMNELFDKLGTLPGRKTVLLYSPGLLNTGDPDQFQAMINRARKSAVTLYAIDANGLTENSTALASGAALAHSASLSSQQRLASGGGDANGASNPGSGAATMEKARQDDYTMEAVRMTDTQAALRGLAEGTGGFLVGSTNDYAKSYQRILEDIDTHYEAVYHPSSTSYDGRLRSIEVKPLRAGLAIESRAGYFALPPSPETIGWNPSELTALTALNLNPAPKAFSFHTAGYQFRSSPAETQHGLVFEIAASNFTLQPDPAAHKQRLHLSLVSLVRDASGQIVDQFAQDASFEIPDDKLGQLKQNVITYTHPLSLGPGFFAVDTAVVDTVGQRAATSKFMFNNAPQPGLNMSSIMLVQRLDPVSGKADSSNPFEFQAGKGEWRTVVPELRSAFLPTAKPAAYFVVYPDPSAADKPQIEVEFRNGGKVLAKQTTVLPPPDATGAIPMVVGVVPKVGNCELRITAIQGAARTMQNLYYTIVAQ